MITSNASLIWPLLILASSVLIAAAVFKFGGSLRSMKAKHMPETKEIPLPKVEVPQTVQPVHLATRQTVEWDSAKSVDFGAWQGLKFGFGFGIGMFLSVIFLSLLGLWFFGGILHAFLASMPAFR